VAPLIADRLLELEGEGALLSCVDRGEPCVIRGAARDWPAIARWTLADLRERLGSLQVRAARLRERRLGIDPRRGIDLTAREARSVIEEIERGGDSAYLMTPLEALPAELRAEAPVPAPCRGAPWLSSKLWESPGGAVSPLHFDMPHNLLAQISGTKRFLIFERGHFTSMYPEPPWSSVPNLSRVDPMNPDLARFPGFRRARPFVGTLGPGDLIFIPRGTWHHATSETASISVNFWWARGPLAWLARASDAWKRAWGISG
jgi:hypothetical protein